LTFDSFCPAEASGRRPAMAPGRSGLGSLPSDSSGSGFLQYDGPSSPLYSTAYPRPGCIYLLSFAAWLFLGLLRYGLAWLSLDLVVVWAVADNVVRFHMVAALAYHIFVSHHRWRYLGAEPLGDVHPSQITHCLAVLVANEPREQLLGLVSELKSLPCQGRKVLIIGMEEAATRDPESKLAEVRLLNELPGGHPFDEVLHTVHHLRYQEIVGTGSNHYEVQVAAERHFADKSNVVMSKFDVNMRLDNSRRLLQEIESVWCSVDKATRRGITFMPNIVWCADVPDLQRTTMEKIVSFGMCATTCVAPFSMAFVSGSLEGLCSVGYTPPCLLSEDELLFTKKQCLLVRPRTYRLCSMILKVFVAESGNRRFLRDFCDKKLKRWFIGWLEVQFYMFTWIFFRGRLHNVGAPHPPVRNPLRALGTWFLCFQRMYMAFVIPLSFIPMIFIWRAAYQKNAKHLEEFDEHYYGEMLALQLVAFCSTIVLDVSIAIVVIRRMYSSFDCLKFRCSTVGICVFGSVVFVTFPIFLLWTFLKHGVLNMPAGHVVVVAATWMGKGACKTFHTFQHFAESLFLSPRAGPTFNEDACDGQARRDSSHSQNPLSETLFFTPTTTVVLEMGKN